jgi:hypothetical protein
LNAKLTFSNHNRNGRHWSLRDKIGNSPVNRQLTSRILGVVIYSISIVGAYGCAILSTITQHQNRSLVFERVPLKYGLV